MSATKAATQTRAWWRGELWAFFVLAAVAVINIAILVIGHRTYFAEPDNVDQFWAWYQKADATLHTGALPLWDMNTLAGHSFVGEVQTGVFYPLNLLWLLVLGGAHGIGPRRLDLLVVLHLLIASTGFYALARSFRVRRPAAVIAGVVFAYTGGVFSRTTGQTAIFFGLALLPWAVFFAHRHLETKRLRFSAGAGACMGLAVLAGHFQPPFHAALVVVILYALTGLGPREDRRAEVRVRVSGLIVTFLTAAVVALPELVYVLPYLARAYRFAGEANPVPPGGSVTFKTFSELYSGGPESILSLIDPERFTIPDGNELFMGLAALVVVVVGCVAYRPSMRVQMGRYRLALIATGLLGALSVIGPWTVLPRVLYVLPLVTEIRELARYAILINLVLCLLLAFALQAVSDGSLRQAVGGRRAGQGVAVMGVVVVINGLYLIEYPVPGGTGWFGVQLLLGGIVLLALALGSRMRRVPLIGVLGVLIVAASLQNGLRLLGNTSSPLYPSHYYTRTAAISYAEGACAGHRTVVLEEAFPTNVAEVFRGLRTQNGYGATMHVPFFDFISASSWTSPEQTALLDLRCIVARKPIEVRGYHLGFREGSAGPLIYVDDNTSPLNTPALQPIYARVLTSSDRRLRYQVDLPAPTNVVVSAIVYPGWRLRLDGRLVEAGSFRVGAVPVFPELVVVAGVHTIEYSWSGWPAWSSL
jgi:hypothetical protein